jgi:uncharacterized Fe-S center protein
MANNTVTGLIAALVLTGLSALLPCASAQELTEEQAEQLSAPEPQDTAVEEPEPAAAVEDGPPKVYFTPHITPESLVDIYEALGVELEGRVAVKLHSGEPGGERNHFLSANLIESLIDHVDGTIVETNATFGGRTHTGEHEEVMHDHGFAEIAPFEILDEKGTLELPVARGSNIEVNYVGAGFADYDSFMILSHFKGHAMAGYGGAIKNVAIGFATPQGKYWLHSGGKTRRKGLVPALRAFVVADRDAFLESMAEAAGSIVDAVDSAGGQIVYINVMNNLSVDCDCVPNPAAPQLHDMGVLASLDPVALDKACLDKVYEVEDETSAALKERIESRNGFHTLEHAEAIGLGSQSYELITLH